MVQRVEVILTDDLDGSAADETVHFGLDGKSYEIDLASTNGQKLREALAPFVAAGRKAGKGNKKPARHTAFGADTAAVRKWAMSNGYELNSRGRIPQDVRDAFEEAERKRLKAPVRPMEGQEDGLAAIEEAEQKAQQKEVETAAAELKPAMWDRLEDAAKAPDGAFPKLGGAKDRPIKTLCELGFGDLDTWTITENGRLALKLRAAG